MLQPAKGLQGSTTRRIWDWSPESMWVWCQVLVIPSLGKGEIRLFLWFSVQLYWCTLVGFADGGRGITSSRPAWGYLVRRPNWFRFGEPWVSIWVLRKQKQKQTNKWQLRKCNIQGCLLVSTCTQAHMCTLLHEYVHTHMHKNTLLWPLLTVTWDLLQRTERGNKGENCFAQRGLVDASWARGSKKSKFWSLPASVWIVYSRGTDQVIYYKETSPYP